MNNEKVARITITLPPELLKRAEDYAERHHINRSVLFSLAMEKFLSEVDYIADGNQVIQRISLTGADLLESRTPKYFQVGETFPEHPEFGIVSSIDFEESINAYIISLEGGQTSSENSIFGPMTTYTASASHYYVTSYASK